MRRSKFNDEEIARILHEQEAGQRTADICHRHGISLATFFNWKAKFGGLEPGGIRRLRELEGENKRLKRLLAESILDIEKLKNTPTGGH